MKEVLQMEKKHFENLSWSEAVPYKPLVSATRCKNCVPSDDSFFVIVNCGTEKLGCYKRGPEFGQSRDFVI